MEKPTRDCSGRKILHGFDVRGCQKCHAAFSCLYSILRGPIPGRRAVVTSARDDRSPAKDKQFKDYIYFPELVMMQFTSEEAYARLISHNMTVPQRIKATGDIGDDDNTPNGYVGGWDYANEKFDMKVPERILVVGQDQHLGTKAPPREIQLDNAVLPTDPGMIRVSTPPRVITLDQHYFPSADDFPMGMPNSPPRNVKVRSQGDGARSTPRPDNFNESTMTESRLVLRDPTPPMGSEGLSLNEEMIHLRRQIVKLNRRVMSIEADQMQRQQKEKIAYAMGIAYLIFKVIAWLNRS